MARPRAWAARHSRDHAAGRTGAAARAELPARPRAQKDRTGREADPA
jgi:hypothetical protein